MATVQKFEDLICWQRARELANFVFDITEKPQFKSWELKGQIRRAAISPISNIAEGFDRGTQNEFVDALFIAKGEVGEVRSQLYLARDRGYLDISTLRNGLSLTDECSRLIQSFVEKVKGGGARGLQFKKILKPDKSVEILKQYAPEMYEKFFGDQKPQSRYLDISKYGFLCYSLAMDTPVETNPQPQSPVQDPKGKQHWAIWILSALCVLLALNLIFFFKVGKDRDFEPDQDMLVPPPHIGTPVVPDTPAEETSIKQWVGVKWETELIKLDDNCQTVEDTSALGEIHDREYCGDDITNYLAGVVTAGQYLGQKVYLMQAAGLGTYYDHYVEIDGRKVYFQDNIGIRGIDDLPDEINYPLKAGYTLKEGRIGQTLFQDTTIERKLFTHATLGDFYLAADGCIIVQLPDSTVLSYDFDLSFVNEENGDVDFTINTRPNQESYDFRWPTCVANCYYWDTIEEEDLKPDTRLKQIGTAANGESVFGLSDPNDQALQDIYNNKQTMAYLPEDGTWPTMSQSKYTYEEFLALYPLLYWKDPLDRWIEFRNRKTATVAEMCKPVIYLYPEAIKNVRVSVAPNGGFTYTEPAYRDGWNVIATPGGRIFDLSSSKVYDYLFWEGIGLSYPQQEEGFVVKQEDLKIFLDETLAKLGLEGKEIDDFEEYWLARLVDKPFYKISFVSKASFDQIAPLTVSGDPDTIIRVMMTASGLDQFEEIPEQFLGKKPVRHGFVVVEWGGALLQ
ncbi:MAG: four helix bundle protein [bacterium]|nr:four helix bundle protein [bacterium]